MENNWPERTLGDVIITNDSTYSKKDKWKFINYLDTGNLTENQISEVQYLVVGEDKIPSRAKRKIEPGDIVYSTVRPNQKHYGILKNPAENLLVSTGFVTIRAKEEADTNFIYWFLVQPAIIERLQTIGEHSTSAYPSIKPSDIEGLKLNLPPLTEQKAIAHILGSLDDKIELNRRMNETLEAMAQALFKSWFVDFDPVIDNALAAGNDIPEELSAKAEVRRMKAEENNSSFIPHNSSFHHLFPSEFEHTEEMGWIPKGWKVETFGYFLADTIGGDWGKEKPDEKHTERVLIIRGTDMPDLRSGSMGSVPIRWVEKKKLTKRKLEDGDIVIEVSGGSPKQPTGRSLYMTQNIIDRLGGVSEPASFCRLFRPKSQEYGLIASQHLTYIYSQGKMWEYQNQSTGISNFQTTSFLERERIVMPDVNEILIFFLDVVRPLIDKSSDNQSIGLSNLRDTLLPQLLSGEMRIPEAEKLVEEFGIMRDEL